MIVSSYKILLVLLLSCFHLGLSAKNIYDVIEYEGTVGETKIELQIKFVGNKLQGSYSIIGEEETIHFASEKDYIDEDEFVYLKEYNGKEFKTYDEIQSALDISTSFFKFSLADLNTYEVQNELLGIWMSEEMHSPLKVKLKKLGRLEEKISDNTELNFVYQSLANDMADIQLAVYASSFQLHFKNYEGGYEVVYKGEVIQSHYSIILIFGEDKPSLSDLFYEKYDKNNAFEVLSEEQVEILMDYEEIFIWGITCVRY